MVGILPWLGVAALGYFALGCASDKNSAHSPQTSTVVIPEADPQGVPKKESPEAPPLCFDPIFHNRYWAIKQLERHLHPLQDFHSSAGQGSEGKTPDPDLKYQMGVQGSFPLDNADRSSQVFVDLQGKIYDRNPEDGFRTLFISLRAYHCDVSPCKGKEPELLRTEVLSYPVRIPSSFSDVESGRFWLQLYFGNDEEGNSKNHLGALIGYDQYPIGVLIYIQSDPKKCVSDQQLIDEMLDEELPD